MPDLSISRQDVLARQLLKHPIGLSPRGLDFRHDKHSLSVANSLFQAIIKGNMNKVRLLLSRGANLNARNDYGHSPLVAALHIEDDQKRNRMFRLLLEKGTSYKARDEQFSRPVLLWACILGQYEQVKTLLEEAAGDINLQDKDIEGMTALHHAVRVGSLAIVDKLVEFHVRFGVSVDAADKLGLTAYMHARRLGYRDVAAVLRTKGLASAGHGDNLFRSPREWSQIGKFERKKAIELQVTEQANAAKILGKLNLAKYVENSPRMAIPGIVVPSYRPPQNNGQWQRKPPHHISVSLPSLGEAVGNDADLRPSTGQDNYKDTDGCQNSPKMPGPPKVAFADNQATDSKSSLQSSSHGNFRLSTHDSNNRSGVSSNNISHHSEVPRAAYGQPVSSSQQLVGKINGHDYQNYQNNGLAKGAGPQPATRSPPARINSNLQALSLLEQSSFSKGRVAHNFYHSEFDETKASEYKHMMGNLNSIMDVLSQQQTKSFRQSVEVKKPETPPKVKKRNKISTFAILFGDRKSARRKKSKSPAGSSAKKRGAKSGARKEEKHAKGSKGDKQSSCKTGGGKKSDATEKAQKSVGRIDKLPVPTIKIN